MTTQCEAYEVMKLREVPQGHVHTDSGGTEQAAYEEVRERLRVVSGGRGPQQDAAGAAGASGPQQEATTQQIYEEVATLHGH